MLLDMKKISMNFDSVAALKEVDFTLEKGEIHGLLGENGAGKSTLMNILGGVLKPTSGEVFLEDNKLEDLDERKASKLGIRFIHQELNLVNDLTVQENLFLGEEITTKLGLLDRQEMIDRSGEILKKTKVDIDPRTMVSDLDTSYKQLVEIAKALLFQSKIIIMDEPTTALTDEEIKNLFEIMRNLKAQGVSIIYISHKMPELFEICDRFTVLRDGKLVSSGFFKDINVAKATELLVGQHITDEIMKDSHAEGTMLIAEHLSCDNFFADVSFELKRGEVLVFTGLQGDGRGELAEALFGARKLSGGIIRMEGKELNLASIKKVMQSGIGMIQRNRKERSIIRDMSILDNLAVAKNVSEDKYLLINQKSQYKILEECKELLNLKVADPNNEITYLSGGNQQKVIISRWLSLRSKVYIFDNPTQGVDVGAKFEIYKLINDLVKQKVSIILFTSEYPEIQKVGDRCIVMYKGKINAVLDRKEFSENRIMYYAIGANEQGEQK
jgi:ABC-type sugar transport system ATPase subunit